MIEDPPLLTVRRRFPRPSHDVVAALSGVPTGYLVDCMNGYGAMDYRIKPLEQVNSSFAGVALTCHAGPADNLAVFGCLPVAQPGDVIVAAADDFTTTCVTGDLLLGMAKNCGVGAFVTDGLIRDVEGIREVGIPVFSRGVTPNSPARNGPGTVGMEVTLGGVHVRSGDIVVGDENGVVVVPHERAKQVVERLADIREAEAGLDAKVKAGLKIPPFFEDVIASGRIKEVD